MYVYFGYGKVSVSCVIVENNLYSKKDPQKDPAKILTRILARS